MTVAFFIGNMIAIKRRVKIPLDATIFGELDSKTDRLKIAFNTVFGGGATTGQAICDNPDIGLPSFAGSVDMRTYYAGGGQKYHQSRTRRGWEMQRRLLQAVLILIMSWVLFWPRAI